MNTIITIGRQFGSGGKEIGIRVAKELGIPFYDKEILQETAKKSGLCEKILENFDERPKSLLYSIAMDSYMFALPGTGAGDSLEQQVYLATFNTIRQIARNCPEVLVGAGTVLNLDQCDRAIAAGLRVTYYPIKGTWIDVGSPVDFRQAGELMRHHNSMERR